METTEWVRARAALDRAVTQVTALLRSAHDSRLPAVGDWNVAELAMHLSQAWLVVPGLASGDLSELHALLPDLPVTVDGALLYDIWDLEKMTRLAVQSDPERDPGALADRIADRCARYLADTAGRPPGERHAWLVEGASVTLQMLTCHLLSETVTHGYDLARALGRPWPIDPDDAALILHGFLIQVLRALPPHAMVHSGHSGGAARFDVRIRGNGGYHFVFDRGELHVREPSAAPVDCHISADPAALLLLMWGRRPQWRAIARGELVAWGRQPWLGPRLRAMIRNP
jgi:uncharacterized protein (TIGR03083 family)